MVRQLPDHMGGPGLSGGVGSDGVWREQDQQLRVPSALLCPCSVFSKEREGRRDPKWDVSYAW